MRPLHHHENCRSMIPLNQYTRRLAAKALNAAADLTGHFTPDQVSGIRHIDGVAQVRVTDGDRSYVLPFDAVEFRNFIEAHRLEVIAALSTEQAWERRRRPVAAVPTLLTRLASFIRYFAPRRRSFIYQVEEA